jgi:hypothetical protein
MMIRANGTGLREVRHGDDVLNENGECIRCTGYTSIAWQPLRR